MKSRELQQLVPVDRGSSPEPTEISRALVIGISRYPVDTLSNAHRDARSVARLLDRDFGFELIGGGPLLDGAAHRARIETALDALFDGLMPHDQCVLYFAGHGDVIDGRGFLVPVDAEDAPASRGIGFASLVGRFQQSPARGLLILDACYAGRALQRVQVDPLIEVDDEDPRGGLHLLAAGGPHQAVPDGIEGGHSPFTAALLRGLDGRVGWHEANGTVSASRLVDRLPDGTRAMAREIGARSHRSIAAPDVIADTLRVSASGQAGHVAFTPRHDRLAPDLVIGLRDHDGRTPTERRELMDQLGRQLALQAKPNDALAWHLPLVFDLLLDGLRDRTPTRRADHDELVLNGKMHESEKADPRAATVRVLTTVRRRASELLTADDLAEHVDPEAECHLRSETAVVREALVHLALRDPDPIVRWLAGRGLFRSTGDDDRSTLRDELEPLHRDGDRTVRRRARALEAHLGGRPLRWIGDAVAHGSRRAWRAAWSRRLAKVVMFTIGGVYALVAATYHVDTTPDGRLILRSGPPGFEAVPGAGEAMLGTGWHENHLIGQRLPRDPRPWHLWFDADGPTWGRRVAALLSDEHAIAQLWRLGATEQASNRLRVFGRDGRADAVAQAAYLSLHDPAFDRLVPEVATVVLTTRGGGTAAAQSARAVGLWCSIRGVAPNPSWIDAVRRACVEASAVTEPTSVPTPEPPPRLDLLALDWRGDDAVRSAALGRLSTAIESGRLDPRDTDAAEAILRRAMADPLPWNRAVAADTLVVLGTSSDVVYRRALDEVFAAFDADRSGPSYGWKVAARFRHASPDAVLRFAHALAGRSIDPDADAVDDLDHLKVRELLGHLGRDLVTRLPDRLGDVLNVLHPVLGVAVADAGHVWLWEATLREIMAAASAGDPNATTAIPALLERALADPRRSHQRSAVSMVALLRESLPADELTRLRPHLIARLDSVDDVLVSRAGMALALLVEPRPAEADALLAVLVDALATRTRSVSARVEIARALALTARHVTPSRSHVERIAPLLDDSTPDIRRRLGLCLVRWLANDPSSGHALAASTFEAKARIESDPEARVEWLTLWGLADDGEHAGRAIDRLAEIEPDGAHWAAFRVQTLASTYPAVTSRALAFFDRCWRRLSIRQPMACIAAARQLGDDDPRLARRVVDELFVPMLFDAPDRLGHLVLTSGLESLGERQPTVAPLILSHLERFADALATGRVTLQRQDPGHVLGRALASAWLDVAEAAEPDDRFLLRCLGATSGWQRERGLDLLRRLARDHPHRHADLTTQLDRLRRSWRPEVRITAARGAEIVRLATLHDTLEPERREAFRELVESVRMAVNWAAPETIRAPRRLRRSRFNRYEPDK